MGNISVTQLHIYPIKSAGGIPLKSARLVERGFHLDRRWMIVDSAGRFITQREMPRIALIRVQVMSDHLAVQAPGMPRLDVPLTPPAGESTKVVVWDDTVEAIPAVEHVSGWFSKFLNAPCSLVHMPDTADRPVDPEYSLQVQQVSFADAFPLLLISEGSLADLNERLDEPLPMNRFRPNIVVKGCEGFAEDGWREISIGDVRLRVAKPCARCITTTVDQATGIRGKEPLFTLSRYRARGNKVLFGQNLIHQSTGIIHVGDEVKVLA